MLLSKLFTLNVIIVGATADFHLRNQVIVNHGYSDISDEIFDNLSREDGDFINFNINKVQIANGVLVINVKVESSMPKIW